MMYASQYLTFPVSFFINFWAPQMSISNKENFCQVVQKKLKKSESWDLIQYQKEYLQMLPQGNKGNWVVKKTKLCHPLNS